MKLKIYFLIIVLILTQQFFTQGGPPVGPGGPGCWPPPCIPIDGGITIFGIIAAIFGYRIISKNNKIS